MSKSKLRILIIIIIIIILFAIVIISGKTKVVEKQVQNSTNRVELNYDNENKLFYVRDKETGEIRASSENEEDLQIFLDFPEYNPEPWKN